MYTKLWVIYYSAGAVYEVLYEGNLDSKFCYAIKLKETII